MNEVIPYDRIEGKIYLLRGKKVMLDRDLAVLYGVETKALNQAVKRNTKRFPDDFIFSLNREEISRMSQSVTSSNLKFSKSVYVFTEQGIAMLSSVLNSERAIMVNIQIIRTFAKLREMIQENDSLRRKVEVLEKDYDEKFRMVFDAIRRLLDSDDKPEAVIGFEEKND